MPSTKRTVQLTAEIRAGERHCDDECYWLDWRWCRLFPTTKGDMRRLRADEDGWRRCQQCLDVEVDNGEQ